MLNNFSNLIDVIKAFPDHDSCIKYLEQLVWSEGVICPICDSNDNYYLPNQKRHKCKNKQCGKQFTVLKGMIFESTKIPLNKWFVAIFLVNSSKKGISSIQLSKDITVTQKTAWFMLQRIRETFQAREDEVLSGVVECDETYIGGKRKGSKRGRGGEHKVPVFGMIERGGKLKAMVVENCKATSLQPQILYNVKNVNGVKTKLMTDEFKSYRSMGKYYHHQVICHMKKIYAIGEVHTNTIEGFWSWLKKAIKGIFHWTSKKHLQRYVNEFVFKYNNRSLTNSEQLVTILKSCKFRLKYKQLIAWQKTKKIVVRDYNAGTNEVRQYNKGNVDIDTPKSRKVVVSSTFTDGTTQKHSFSITKRIYQDTVQRSFPFLRDGDVYHLKDDSTQAEVVMKYEKDDQFDYIILYFTALNTSAIYVGHYRPTEYGND